jgi:Protein of unknown function (DUF2959)
MPKTFASRHSRALLFCTVVALLSGCSSAYYGALESIGIPKREVLVHRIEKARDSQEDAKEQFQSALEQFSALTGFKGGDLEKEYKRLNSEYEASVDKADAVNKRIDDIEDVADALFSEWQEELGQYSSAALRSRSEQKLKTTRRQYDQLIKTMKRAEAKIEPVLTVFHDQVMYLKHNLNAQAIASLKTDLKGVETDVAALVRSMEQSIDEANAFIKSMEGA